LRKNDKVTYKPTLRPKTSLSNLERALSETSSGNRTMALNMSARFNTFNTIFLVLLAKEREDLGLWSQFKKTIETNDLVTELERIKAK
jgi:hypothetical protein